MIEEVRLLFDYHPDGYLIHRTTGHQGSWTIGTRVGRIDNRSGYEVITWNNKAWKLHRLIWCWHHGQMPDNLIDHINRVRSDNRIENLRDVTYGENQLNRVDSTRNGGYCRINGKLTEFGKERHRQESRDWARRRAANETPEQREERLRRRREKRAQKRLVDGSE